MEDLQIAEAVERKPRAPNERLQQVTERRLAEADRRVLHRVTEFFILLRHLKYVAVIP